LVDLYLVERQFDLPALVVGGGKVDRGSELVVCDRGDEAEQLSAAGRSLIWYSMTRMRMAWVASRCSPAAAAARSISRRRPRTLGLISRDR
jgi:hypothetical protein